MVCTSHTNFSGGGLGSDMWMNRYFFKLEESGRSGDAAAKKVYVRDEEKRNHPNQTDVDKSRQVDNKEWVVFSPL